MLGSVLFPHAPGPGCPGRAARSTALIAATIALAAAMSWVTVPSHASELPEGNDGSPGETEADEESHAAAAELVAGVEVWVDDDPVVGLRDGSSARPYATIAEGVAEAQNLGAADYRNVYVLPGTYVALELVLPTGVRLLGLNQREEAELPGCRTWQGTINGTLVIRGDDVHIRNLALRQPAPHWNEIASVYIEGSTPTVADPQAPVSGAVVACNDIDGGNTNLARGVLTAVARDLRIERNKVAKAHLGIYLNPGASGLIVENEVTGMASTAIGIDTAEPVTIEGNVIRANQGNGISISQFHALSVVRRNSLSANSGSALASVAPTSVNDPFAVAPEVSAQQNWWSSADGPRLGPVPDAQREVVENEDAQVVTGPVEVDPWCPAEGCHTAPITISGTVQAVGAITGLEVRATGSGVPTVSVDVQSNGAYSTPLLVPWSELGTPIQFTARCKSSCSYVSQSQTRVIFDDVLAQTVPPFRYGLLNVTVRDGQTNAARASTPVTVVNGDSGAAVVSGVTDSAGLFAVRLVEGSYQVQVYDAFGPVSAAITATQTTALDLKYWSVAGTVTDQDGQPVTGAAVQIATSAGAPARNLIETGATGTFEFWVPAGSYKVQAVAPPAHSAESTATVGPGNPPAPVNLMVVEAFVTVAVRGDHGDPMGGVAVTATSPGKAAVTKQTAGDGTARFAIAAGDWTFKAEADGYQDDRDGPLVMATGDARTVALVMRPRATSTGVGSGSAGGGAASAGGAGGATVAPPAPAVEPQPGPLPSGQDSRAQRVSGGDRAGTAASLSASSFPEGAEVVYVAAAGGFADALAGGPAAARAGGPVLLVDRDRLPEATRAEIERLGAARVVVLGGDGAVSASVEAQLRSLGAEVERVRGGDRFATAAEVSRRSFAPGVAVAYVATGGGFADALSGGAAAARQGGPVLLVTADGVPASTEAELRRLGPGRIVVLGGPGAVTPQVAARLDELTAGSVQRVSGGDRYATSAAVSASAFSGPVDTVYVATGENFPDALAGVPAAAKDGAPLLLVRRDGVPGPIAAELERLSPRRIVILGGDGAVSRDTERQLAAYARA